MASVVFALSLLDGAIAHAAAAVPQNLGGGLSDLVESNLALASLAPAARAQAAPFNGFATADAADFAALAMRDAQGRYVVRVQPDAGTTATALAAALRTRLASLDVLAVDTHFRGVGVFDGWIGLDDVPALATYPGVESVVLELRPKRRAPSRNGIAARKAPSNGARNYASSGQAFPLLGTLFDAGVIEHRVDQINRFYNPSAPVDYEGSGIQVGVISDSFAKVSGGAATDVTHFDLPGAAGNPVNTTPVLVLQEGPSGSFDEGREMLQLVYKMAPKATLAFATGVVSEVGMANNIRALAGIAANRYPAQTFVADVICDDVTYYDEPYYQDGVLAQAAEDAVAAGVAYFGAAGDLEATKGYESALRWVTNGSGATAAAGNTALANTNLNLGTIPVAAMPVRMHNFNPASGGLDVAQTINLPARSTDTVTLQWDEPAGAGVVSSIYLYVFDINGNYITYVHVNNTATHAAFTDGFLRNTTTLTQVQVMLGEAVLPATAGATRVQYTLQEVFDPTTSVAEYVDYNNAMLYGHVGATGVNGVAVYGAGPPNTPDPYSSPGPETLYLDSTGNRLAVPEVREQPTVAAVDGVPTTVEPDGIYSTSAAAAHAAAIAALVLQAHGGSHSVTPAQMTTLLEQSTYLHDLDPFYVSGVARTVDNSRVTVRVRSGGGDAAGIGAQDSNAFQVTYDGSGGVTALNFNAAGAPATGGNVNDGTLAITIAGSQATYTETRTPGMVFDNAEQPFLLGSASTVPAPGATFTTPFAANQYYSMGIAFTSPAMLTAFSTLAFTVGRRGAISQYVNSGAVADLLGGAVATPSAQLTYDGMVFSGVSSTGNFSGTLKNRLGAGYSPLDGYGLINAQSAVSQVLP